MDTILECTANGAGSCRNESMILELQAERDAARDELATLRAIAENLRSRYYNGANPGWAELKQYLDETAEPSSIQHGCM